jgi:hypothetical protein
VGLNARTDTAKGRDQERASEQGGAGDETDDKGEAKIFRPEQREIEQAMAFGHYLLAEKCQQSGCADRCQPQDARFIEPVPSAALAEDIGEAQKGDGDE